MFPVLVAIAHGAFCFVKKIGMETATKSLTFYQKARTSTSTGMVSPTVQIPPNHSPMQNGHERHRTSDRPSLLHPTIHRPSAPSAKVVPCF